jgi:hypothetical protein
VSRVCYSLFVWLISHQPTVLFSQNKPVTNDQSTVLFSQNKSVPVINHQPNEQAVTFLLLIVVTNAAGSRSIELRMRSQKGCEDYFSAGTARIRSKAARPYCHQRECMPARLLQLLHLPEENASRRVLLQVKPRLSFFFESKPRLGRSCSCSVCLLRIS